MSRLIIDNKYLVDEPIINILYKLKKDIKNNKLDQIIDKKDQILVTCPHHKGGMENKPSCYIGCEEDNYNYIYGTCHCFSCGYKGQLYDFVAECFDKDREFGKNWLIYNYGKILSQLEIELEEPIILERKNNSPLKDSVLSNMKDYHPYMETRKLDPEICKEFNVKYDPKTNSLVFPVYDEKNNLVLLTKRNVSSKKFYIDKGTEKPVYLLNFIKNKNIKNVFVCESQINALYLWSLGYPAIALIGTGTKYQYDILNKSGIQFYHLCFDGDEAGDKGKQRFLKNITKEALTDIVDIPRGKDINDLSPQEVKILLG